MIRRKTKIVGTLGPATDKEGVLEELVREGLNVARFNFSHGTHEEQKARLDQLKIIREEMNLPIAALLDTKGPEIRLKHFAQGKVELTEGDDFFLTSDDIEGTAEGVSVTYADLYKDIKPGDTVLIDDGLVALTVKKITGKKVECTVKNSGTISNQKSVNLPGVEVRMPFISQKDLDDILFGIQEDFDFIAASFVRTASDVKEIRKILDDNGGESLNIIAKIENQQGVDNIEEIIEIADGIMIARGDMGVEIPLENVPIIQKNIIRKVYNAGKQVITATQMLESMMNNPRPTRAEATDVANAIYQGTSAIMLSGETAAGKYPVESLRTMVRIAVRTEADIDYLAMFTSRGKEVKPDMTTAISHATVMTAMDLGAKTIITVSKTGRTARMISKYRPQCKIVGCSPDPKACRKLNMSWGVYPVTIKEEFSMEVLFLRAIERAKDEGYVEKGDVVVLTAGIPLGQPGQTNLIKAEEVG